MYLREITPYILEWSEKYLRDDLTRYFSEHPEEERIVDIAGCLIFDKGNDVILSLSKVPDFRMIDSSSTFNERVLRENEKAQTFLHDNKDTMITLQFEGSTQKELSSMLKNVNGKGVVYKCIDDATFPLVLLSQILYPATMTWYMDAAVSGRYLKYTFKKLYYRKNMFQPQLFESIISNEQEIIWVHNDTPYVMEKTDPFVIPSTRESVPFLSLCPREMILPASLGEVRHTPKGTDTQNPWYLVIENIVSDLKAPVNKKVTLKEFLAGGQL